MRVEQGPDKVGSQVAMLPALTMFAAKATIVAILCTASIIVVGGALNAVVSSKIDQVERSFKDVVEAGRTPLWTHIERELDRAADPSRGPTVEQQQQFLAKLQAAKARWSPFLNQVQAILVDKPEAAPATRPDSR